MKSKFVIAGNLISSQPRRIGKITGLPKIRWYQALAAVGYELFLLVTFSLIVAVFVTLMIIIARM